MLAVRLSGNDAGHIEKVRGLGECVIMWMGYQCVIGEDGAWAPMRTKPACRLGWLLFHCSRMSPLSVQQVCFRLSISHLCMAMTLRPKHPNLDYYQVSVPVPKPGAGAGAGACARLSMPGRGPRYTLRRRACTSSPPRPPTMPQSPKSPGLPALFPCKEILSSAVYLCSIFLEAQPARAVSCRPCLFEAKPHNLTRTEYDT